MSDLDTADGKRIVFICPPLFTFFPGKMFIIELGFLHGSDHNIREAANIHCCNQSNLHLGMLIKLLLCDTFCVTAREGHIGAVVA